MNFPKSAFVRRLRSCLGLIIVLLGSASVSGAQVTLLRGGTHLFAYESPQLGEDLVPTFAYDFPELASIESMERTADGRLWAIRSANGRQLYEVDLENRVFTLIGPINALCEADLAISPSGTVFCSFPGEIRRLEPPLYEEAQLIFVPGDGVGISFLGDRLFTSWLDDDEMFLGEVNLETGTISTLGTIETPEDSQTGFGQLISQMSFDNVGRLWVSIFNPGPFPFTGDAVVGMLPNIFESTEVLEVSVPTPSSNLSIVALGPSVALDVPTASTVGLSILALLLASIGAFKLRTR